MWEGGWDLQASFVEDARLREGPFVRVDVYQASQITKGWVEGPVEYSAEERLALDRVELAKLRTRRVALDETIARLGRSIEGGAAASVLIERARLALAQFEGFARHLLLARRFRRLPDNSLPRDTLSATDLRSDARSRVR